MLSIKDLYVNIDDKPVLKGINLEVHPGQVHAIMGPNGSGKSTLSSVIAGKEDYQITQGSIKFNGIDINEMEIDERAKQGLFLAMQYPTEIPGVSCMTFLKAAINNLREHQGQQKLDAVEFLQLVRKNLQELQMDETFLKRSVNSGFSGGEKKRFEILQMKLLQPYLAILDETDSGLDVDALKIVSKGVNSLRSEERAIVVITHYQRLLDHIIPDFVHVLADGKIIKSGNKDLALEIENNGYKIFGINDGEAA